MFSEGQLENENLETVHAGYVNHTYKTTVLSKISGNCRLFSVLNMGFVIVIYFSISFGYLYLVGIFYFINHSSVELVLSFSMNFATCQNVNKQINIMNRQIGYSELGQLTILSKVRMLPQVVQLHFPQSGKKKVCRSSAPVWSRHIEQDRYTIEYNIISVKIFMHLYIFIHKYIQNQLT